MRLRTLAVVAVVVAVSVSVFAQAARRDGNWEVKMEMSMPGMPMQMQPVTMMQCVSKEDANDPTKAFPQQGRGRGPAPNCTASDTKVEGNKVTFTMKCEGPQPMTMKGEMVYGVDSYTGTIQADMDRGGQPMAMTMKYTGKRLGDCTKSEVRGQRSA